MLTNLFNSFRSLLSNLFNCITQKKNTTDKEDESKTPSFIDVDTISSCSYVEIPDIKTESDDYNTKKSPDLYDILRALIPPNPPVEDPTLKAWRIFKESLEENNKIITKEQTEHELTAPLESIEEDEIKIRKYLCYLYFTELASKDLEPGFDKPIDHNIFVFKGNIFIFKEHYEFDIKKIDLTDDFYKGLKIFEESIFLSSSYYPNLKIISQGELHDCVELKTLKTFSPKNPHENYHPILPVSIIKEIDEFIEKQRNKVSQIIHPIYATRVDKSDIKGEPSKICQTI